MSPRALRNLVAFAVGLCLAVAAHRGFAAEPPIAYPWPSTTMLPQCTGTYSTASNVARCSVPWTQIALADVTLDTYVIGCSLGRGVIDTFPRCSGSSGFPGDNAFTIYVQARDIPAGQPAGACRGGGFVTALSGALYTYSCQSTSGGIYWLSLHAARPDLWDEMSIVGALGITPAEALYILMCVGVVALYALGFVVGQQR